MGNYVDVTLRMSKALAEEIQKKGITEIVTRQADAKFKAMIKCNIVNGTDVQRKAAEKLLSAVGNNAERNRKAVDGILSALKEGANNLQALSDTQKSIAGSMDKMFGSMNVVKAMTFLNTGLLLADLAVDVAGFVVISNKLNELSKELNGKLDKVVNKGKNDLIGEYQQYLMHFGNTAQKISIGEKVSFDEYQDLLGEMRPYISKMKSNIIEGVLDTGLALEIIYTLLPAYALIFNEYTKAYYMEKGQKPANYDFMFSLYDEIGSPEMIKTIQDYYFLDRGLTSLEALDVSNMHALMVVNDKIITNDIMQLLISLGDKDKIVEFNNEVDRIVKEQVLASA